MATLLLPGQRGADLVIVVRAGRRVLACYRYRSGSFVQQIVQHLHGLLNFSNETGVVDTGGTSRTVDTGTPQGDIMRLTAAAADDNFGILVGTGTTAEAAADTALATKIATGNGAGQLAYQATTVSTATAITGGYRLTVTRQFDNNSGGAITVQEIGLVCVTDDSAGADRYFLLVRDLTGGNTINNGASATATYNLDFLV